MGVTTASAAASLGGLGAMLPDLQALYTDIHSHPELSMQETRTAGLAAERLRVAGFDVSAGVGQTGVVGLRRRGAGPTVMLRADMDALPVMRLQTIASREVGANDAVVLTVGALQAGTKENVIPDEALLKLNVRTYDAGVRRRVLAAIERVVHPEAAASGAPRPPEITPLDSYALVTNDAAGRLAELPTNHNPRFAPVLHPTLETGVETLVVAAGAWLA